MGKITIARFPPGPGWQWVTIRDVTRVRSACLEPWGTTLVGESPLAGLVVVVGQPVRDP
jgi:hypothetical protein